MKKQRFAGMFYARKRQGFTLVELMIAVAIIGVLAAIAYPSYSQYVVKSNRSAAEGYITGVAGRQQQFMLDARQYFCTTASANCTQTQTVTPPSEVAKNYTVTVTANNNATPPTFVITATPIGSQATKDTKCANLTVNQAGAKGISGTGTVSDCW